MIRYETGNLLTADVEALVNTVNEGGVMGKGIALMFRDAFPENTRRYQQAAKAKQITVGRVFVTQNPETVGPRWIINFPTKKHWRHPSKLEWIRQGLADLVKVVRDLQVRSIAIPPLGAGAGGLDWGDVKSEIERALDAVPGVDIVVYEPTSRYQNVPKAAGVEKLTPARALIAEMVRRYEILGLECTILEVQKLAWFLARNIARLQLRDVLRLTFKADKFGPYDDKLRHLLNALDGSYLHCVERLGDATPFDLIHFDFARQNFVASYLHSRECKPYLPALERTARLIDGFESPLGMELLATVDWMIAEGLAQPELDSVRSALKRWPGGSDAVARKTRLFDDRLLQMALQRLNEPTSPGHNELFASGGV